MQMSITLLQMSIISSILILFIIVVRSLAIHRLPKKLFMFLWKLTLLRLLIPFTVPEIPHFSGSSAAGSTTSSIRYLVNDMSMPIQEGARYVQSVDYTPWIWAAGFILTSIFFLILGFRSHAEIRDALLLDTDCELYQITEKLQRKLTIRKKVKMLTSDKLSTPVTFGFRKPKIIFPKTICCSDQQQLAYIITHELIHIKRSDHLWKCISMCALCLHWFNPLVWVMYIVFNRDMEISCDEKVLNTHNTPSRQMYALSLVQQAEQRNSIPSLYNGFGKNAVQERIVSIMKFKRSGLPGIITAFSLAIISGFFLLTTASASASEAVSSDAADVDFTLDGIMDDRSEFLYMNEYKDFGFSYNPLKDAYYLNGEFVNYFEDNWGGTEHNFSGSMMYDGRIDGLAVYTVRDESGEVIALEVFSEKDAKKKIKAISGR